MFTHFKRFNFLFLTVFLVAAVDLSILRWYFPPTEGWWETYAWLMASGQSLYSDIWISHPPLHVLLIRAQMALVKHDFLMLRLLGVVTHGLTVSLMYLWLRRLTTPIAAFLGALLSTLLIIYPNSAYIVRDYHMTVEFFEVLALLCSVPVFLQRRYGDTAGFRMDQSAIFGIVGTGVACGALLMVKQNIGVFFTAFIGLAIVLRTLEGRRIDGLPTAMASAILFALAFAIFPLVVTLSMGSDWLSVYFSNISKGKPGLVLMRFLVDEDSRKVLFGSILATILFAKFRWIENKFEIIADYFLASEKIRTVLSLLATRAIIFATAGYFIRLAPSHIVFSISLCWLVHRAVHSRFEFVENNAAWYKFGWLPLIGLVYCGTHTAGYNFVSMQLILAPMIADLFNRYGEKFLITNNERNIVLAGIGAAFLVILLKLNGPLYDWWGLKQDGVLAAKYPLPFDELRGFRVDEKTADFFGQLAKYKSTLSADDTVFAYPSIPIVYLLLNKKPPIKLPTLWFDVSDQSQAGKILSDLERTKPSMIFWLKPPDFVYNGHTALRRLPSLISSVDAWLYEKIYSGQYQVESISFFPVKHSWKSDVSDIREPIIAKVFVAHSGLTCKGINNIKGVLGSNCEKGETVVPGSRLSVTFSNRYWEGKSITSIGFPYSTDDDNTFIVLRRNIDRGRSL